MSRCILFLACFAALVLANSSASASSDSDAWQKSLERLHSEATALYAKVLEKEKQPTEQCSINDEWFNETVPESIARQHLGLKLHADLTAPHNRVTPAEVLDPVGGMREAFCSDQELREYEKQVLKKLTDKLIKENAPPSGFEAKRTHIRVDYTFPVFNENFDRAIIVQRWAGRSWTWGSPYYKMDRGNIKLIGSVGGSVHAYIWAKKDGVWQLIDSEEMAQFD